MPPDSDDLYVIGLRIRKEHGATIVSPENPAGDVKNRMALERQDRSASATGPPANDIVCASIRISNWYDPHRLVLNPVSDLAYRHGAEPPRGQGAVHNERLNHAMVCILRVGRVYRQCRCDWLQEVA